MKETGRNILLGAAAGGMLALVFLSIGLVRAVFFIAGGGLLQALKSDDFRMMMAYVGAFVAAGAMVGGLRPMMRTAAGTYVVFSFAGILVMNAIAIADDGWSQMDAFTWIAMSILGIIFGCAFAHGMRKA